MAHMEGGVARKSFSSGQRCEVGLGMGNEEGHVQRQAATRTEAGSNTYRPWFLMAATFPWSTQLNEFGGLVTVRDDPPTVVVFVLCPW